MQPSASNAELLLQCAYPYAEDTPLVRNESTASDYGTAFHAAMAEMLTKGATGAIVHPDLAPHVCRSFEYLMNWLEENHYDKVPVRENIGVLYPGYAATGTFVEISWALYLENYGCCDASLRLEDHHYEGAGPGAIFGTADLVVAPRNPNQPVLVMDHKTGMHGDFSAPEELAQLKLLGFMACKRLQRDTYRPAILHTPKDGLPIMYTGSEREPDYAFIDALAEQSARIGDGSMRPGKMCHYCPARAQCPAKTGELLRDASALVEKATLVGSELVLVSNTNGNLTREEKMGRLHLLMSRFSDLQDRARSEIKRALQADPSLEPIRPDGKRLTLKKRTVERLSKSSILTAYGKVEGAKKLDELREAGALVANEEEMLWAE